MEQRYTEGEEREGERTEQLRLRRRMADYGAAAIAGWETHWGSHCHWWNLATCRATARVAGPYGTCLRRWHRGRRRPRLRPLDRWLSAPKTTGSPRSARRDSNGEWRRKAPHWG